MPPGSSGNSAVVTSISKVKLPPGPVAEPKVKKNILTSCGFR